MKTPFWKYLLVGLLFFGLLTLLCYRLWAPQNKSVTTTELSTQSEEDFVINAQLMDTLYRSYRVAVKGTDPIAAVQARGIFQGKLSEMQKKPATSNEGDSLFRRVIRNYYGVIKVNEEAIQNQKGLATQKLELKDKIDQLTRMNQRLERQIDNISLQPLPSQGAK
ncbi:hypothetical protein P1X15_22310 [Runella sp. MFBS21]|uniref:hypothetical protein n=1 Tax=Runella sp. MFBS21 TaxID=3034018 RepID=UPI0023F8498C|nr:hypothetical protein [Runella sp. MFBS21]MDF7820372.1 hypothetical protein [Runella sp. MFBS21]